MLLSYSASVKDGMLVVSDDLLKFREYTNLVRHQCRILAAQRDSNDGGIFIIDFYR